MTDKELEQKATDKVIQILRNNGIIVFIEDDLAQHSLEELIQGEG